MPLRDLWPPFPAERVLHEDPDLLVIDKPFGMATHAPSPERQGDAYGRLGAMLAARGDHAPYLGIHQRLDKDTSGVLLFTRRQSANRGVAAELEGRRAEKVYVAAVMGFPRGLQTGTLEHRIAPEPGGRVRALPARGREGQLAVTRYRVLGREGERALLELSLETGRTHQIRAQLAAEGAPVAGDPLYGGAPLHRMLLHARELALRHPTGGRVVRFRAPLPELFDAWMRGEDEPVFASVDRLERALREAADRRWAVTEDGQTDALRLANGAGDGLPGLAVDAYGDYLVVSLYDEPATAARERVLDAAAGLGARGVYLKVRLKDLSRVPDTRRDDLAPREAVRGEGAPEPLVVHELGLPYEVRLGDGLSTGVFLDQRENRRRVRELARGAAVLNLFAYTAPFTVAAAAGGARRSASVDVSKTALAWARRNLDGIGADARAHLLVEADAQVWLRTRRASDDRYDLVILDPPSFATTKRSRFSAASDYRALAALAVALVAPGGRLLACTNHRGIVRAKLRRYLHEAARDARRTVAQMKDLPDPIDFPPDPGAESHLKSVLVTLA
jgi:23S rRNA (cytosine1962-C5)-methyltransferase